MAFNLFVYSSLSLLALGVSINAVDNNAGAPKIPKASPISSIRNKIAGTKSSRPATAARPLMDFPQLNMGGIANQLGKSGGGMVPFIGFGYPLPTHHNPDLPSTSSCTALSGEMGSCTNEKLCSFFGGFTSGTCSEPGSVCCIYNVKYCDGLITQNNTYWESPDSVSPSSTCSLTVRLDQQLIGQAKPICQVRLDFVAFSISQPDSSTACTTDNFQVIGAINNVPTICGDNEKQHMYLDVPSSATTLTELELRFEFGDSATVTRSWFIKIATLPCGANYLAPADCLQYFTEAAGKVSSFNWKDAPVVAPATRQLANQDYYICFRTELINRERANVICLFPCTISNGGDSFGLSGTTASSVSATCANDFLIIAGGGNVDRYCGGSLNPTAGSSTSVRVCSTVKPFRILYRTNENEPSADARNVGFCLEYTEKIE